MQIYFRLFIISIFLTSTTICRSQSNDSSLQRLEKLPANYCAIVDKKISAFNDKLTKKSEKYLQKLAHKERTIQQKLQKLNPTITDKVFTSTNEKYDELVNSIKSKTVEATNIVRGQYSSYLDTLRTSLSFLKQFTNISDKVRNPLASLDQLQSKLQNSERIKAFIAERKKQIKELLSKYTHVPAGLKKQFETYSKQAYYYSMQVKEYKDMLKDPKKIEKKVLSLLNKLPIFQKFMKENGQLASLFNLPSSITSNTQILSGLQTRSSVNELIRQRISSDGPNAQAQIQQNLSLAHAELNKIKDRINKLGNGGGDIDMPNYKPNTQKTKSFLKRIEYGTNVQFAKSNSLMPTTSNIAFTIGYKLNDNSIIGVGASYLMGLGSLPHIQITNQGIGVRSFVDYKIKNQFFISGGYEMNYNTQFQNIDQLKKFNSWQRSGLIGVSKRYSISKKVKGNIQFNYDFLANTHIPVTQPFLYRIGYLIN